MTITIAGTDVGATDALNAIYTGENVSSSKGQLPDLAARIEKLLRQRGFRNADHLARVSDIASATLGKIMNGKTQDPSLSTLLKLAASLRVSVSELIGEVEMPTVERSLEQDLWAVSEAAVRSAGSGDPHRLFILLKVFFDLPPEQRGKVEALLVQGIELATGQAITDVIRMMSTSGHFLTENTP